MNRPRQYDREEVVEKATALFWEKGFEATSMNEMVARTGLHTNSMYSEFGNKERLFLECIDHYISKSLRALINILTKKPLGLSNIEAFFENRVDYVATKNCKGCLIVNSLTEKEVLSEEVNIKVKSRISSFTALFYNCIKSAQENNEISADIDCKDLANYLVYLNFGLMIAGKNETSKKKLRKIADMGLSAIRR